MGVEYQTTPGGRTVGINPRYRLNADSAPFGLYIIPCDGGCTTLGFDNAERTRAAVADWLRSEGAEVPAAVEVEAAPGTLAHFDAYQDALSAGRAHHARTGRKCPANLTPALLGFEGARVRVLDAAGAEVSRFWVGRSGGWMPCHIEIKRRDSLGGCAAYVPEGGRVELVRRG